MSKPSLQKLDYRSFAEKQVLDWIYNKQVDSVDAMTNISKEKRQLLAQRLFFRRSKTIKTQKASDGTIKKLLALGRWCKQQTETVMIPAKGRRTACVSSQIGCPVRCTFCASGLGGLEGNLQVGQIIEQVIALGGRGYHKHSLYGHGRTLSKFQRRNSRNTNSKRPMGHGDRCSKNYGFNGWTTCSN